MYHYRLREFFAAHRRSRVAIGLALIHAIVFVVLIFNKQPLPPPSAPPCPAICLDPWYGEGWVVAGRYFHSEVALLAVLVDLPAVVASVVVGVLVEQLMNWAGAGPSMEAASYLLAWLWLLFGTAQWWLCGIVLEGRPNLPLQPTSGEATRTESTQ